jgi:hypothetical protein
MIAYMTRATRAAELEAKGVVGDALEALLAETAAERHASRVAYARAAAEEWARERAGLTPKEFSALPQESRDLMAGPVLAAEVLGVGGQDGVAGHGTARLPAFANCGKGRRNATDGPAWSAAIEQAAREVGGHFAVNEIGAVVYRAPGGEVLLRDSVPVAWERTVLREGLRRAAGLAPWFPRAAMFAHQPESLPHWAAALNSLPALAVPEAA